MYLQMEHVDQHYEWQLLVFLLLISVVHDMHEQFLLLSQVVMVVLFGSGRVKVQQEEHIASVLHQIQLQLSQQMEYVELLIEYQ